MGFSKLINDDDLANLPDSPDILGYRAFLQTPSFEES
jgi:hypothetical protein